MAKIHITLVGGQTAPVYLGIIDANPDKVILIYSDQTEDQANRIYSEMKVECELRKFHPVDLNAIEKSVTKCVNDFGQAETVTINVGGGTKPWSIFFYEHFKNLENAKILYIDQNNMIWDLKNRTNHEVVFDMDVQFRLYGNPLTDYKNILEYTDADKQSINQIRQLREFNFRDFNEIAVYLYNHSNETKFLTKTGSSMEWMAEMKEFRCVMIKSNGKQVIKTLKSPHIRSLLLNTGWFEYEIAVLLSTWKFAKEIRMNCIFPTTDGSPKNEVDIIVNTGTKLLFVECKTKIFNETDIDKFSAAVKNYGGMGSKAIFITDSPMSEKAIEKCNDHGIMTFSLQNSMLGLSVEKILFMLLERELFNINPK